MGGWGCEGGLVEFQLLTPLTCGQEVPAPPPPSPPPPEDDVPHGLKRLDGDTHQSRCGLSLCFDVCVCVMKEGAEIKAPLRNICTYERDCLLCQQQQEHSSPRGETPPTTPVLPKLS